MHSSIKNSLLHDGVPIEVTNAANHVAHGSLSKSDLGFVVAELDQAESLFELPIEFSLLF